MNSNTNPSNTNEAIFAPDVIAMVANRAHQVGVSDWSDRLVALNVTGMISRVSEALVDLIIAKTGSCTVTDSDVEKFLTNLIRLRVQQLNRSLPRGIVAAEVPVPDFFRPVLAKICKFESPSRALNIDVEFAELTDRDGLYVKAEGGVSYEEVDGNDLATVARRLKANGIRFTSGLPRVLATTDDSIFRVCENSQGDLLVAGADVTEVDLLVRSIVRMSFLTDIFGAARTRYLGVEDLRASWEAVVSTAVL